MRRRPLFSLIHHLKKLLLYSVSCLLKFEYYDPNEDNITNWGDDDDKRSPRLETQGGIAAAAAALFIVIIFHRHVQTDRQRGWNI